MEFTFLISDQGLNKVDLLLFCHFDAIVNGLNYFYRDVVEIDCKSEYKIERL